MRAALRARLRAEVADTPVDWVESDPGAALPRVVLTRVSGGASYAHDGADGLGRARVQIDCVAATYSAAVALAEAVKGALSGWRSGEISAVFVIDERDLPGGNANAGQHLAAVSVDVMVHYQEQGT